MDKPGDEAPQEEPATGDTICPDCSGSGERNGASCETCKGTGTVAEVVGGG